MVHDDLIDYDGLIGWSQEWRLEPGGCVALTHLQRTYTFLWLPLVTDTLFDIPVLNDCRKVLKTC